MQVHVVQPGETLSRIVRTYNSDLQEIIRINGLSDPNKLVIGQALIMPTPVLQHKVQQGETLWKIAHTYGVSISGIVEAKMLCP